jgi:hypothetical protein
MIPTGYTIHFFGHCTKDGSDKIWGWAEVGGSLYNFWGKRTGKLSWKRHEGRSAEYDLYNLQSQKIKKGYKHFGNYSMIEELVPGFFATFKSQLFTAKMLNKVKGDSFCAN